MGMPVTKSSMSALLLESKAGLAFRRILEKVRRENKYAFERKVLQELERYPKLLQRYQSFKEETEGMDTNLRYYLFQGNDYGACKGCGKPTKWRATWNRFLDYCSTKCANEYVVEARKETWLEKYGVDNTSKLPEIRAKISKAVSKIQRELGRTKRKIPVHEYQKRGYDVPVYKTDKVEFYVYVLLDTRKPGTYSYNEGKFIFDYEPFYVGKGRRNRAFSHFRYIDKYNQHKYSVIKKILKITGNFPRAVLSKTFSEQKAHEYEKRLILDIGRTDLGTGPLTNKTAGGEGAVGRVITEEQKEKCSKSAKKFWLSLSEKERQKVVEAMSDKRRKTLENKSALEKELTRQRLSKAVRQRYANMSVSDRKEAAKKVAEALSKAGKERHTKYIQENWSNITLVKYEGAHKTATYRCATCQDTTKLHPSSIKRRGYICQCNK